MGGVVGDRYRVGDLERFLRTPHVLNFPIYIRFLRRSVKVGIHRSTENPKLCNNIFDRMNEWEEEDYRLK